METQDQIKKLHGLIWIGGVIVLVAIVVAVSASWLLYKHTSDLLTENLRERLLSISVTQAANISADDLNALQSEEDIAKPEWTRVVSALKRAKDENEDIVFMYIFRKTAEDPTQMEFVADAESINPYANLDEDPNNDVDSNEDGIVEPDGADKLNWPGQAYAEAVDIPEAYEAYNGPLAVSELYEDAYGEVLTGYSPIRDANGNVAAILATDIRAGDFQAIAQQTLVPFLMYIVFLTATIVILATLLIYIWQRRAEAFAELDRMKDEFLSIASHQLRAPMTAIRGYAANIMDGTYGAVPKNLEDPLSTIEETTRLMISSIEDYLNISRIEQGRMKYEKSQFDVSEIAQKVIKELTPVATKRGLALTIDAPAGIVVNADIGKIKQIVTNLTDNAIKYTQKGSVAVSITKDGKWARIVVKDTGVGISQDEIGHLFEKFTRARNANRVNTTGTGLGLYVAKQLIEGHAGTLTATSAGPGTGSEFTVMLPLAG